MILLDYNQIFISNMMKQIGTTATIEPNLIRHMVLNSIRMYHKNFSKKYGELVICADTGNYWRRDIFPNYKAGRKSDRQESPFDWSAIFESLAAIRYEIAENFPYHVLAVPRCEADDIIAHMCHVHGYYSSPSSHMPDPQLLILSADKDFIQLQKYSNVSQYSPIQKKFIAEDNPERFLREHIILGDKSDGIPNILSDDNVFVEGRRQKSIFKEKLDLWSKSEPEHFCTTSEMMANYNRNASLIDLSKIPSDVRMRINQAYLDSTPPDRSKILPYLMEYRLKSLTENIGDF